MRDTDTNVKLRIVSTCFQFSEIETPHLREEVDFRHNPPLGQGFSSSEMAAIASGANILVAGDDQLDSLFFSKAHGLRLLIRWGAGLDNVDMEAAKQHSVEVRNTPHLFGEDVADLALLHGLAVVRNHSENMQAIRSGKWVKRTSYSFRDMTFGILGMGTIGAEIARLLRAFGSKVLAFDPYVEAKEMNGIHLVPSKETLFEAANLVFLAAPLTKETAQSVGLSDVLVMPEPRFLVNVSRGELVRQEEVLEALESGLLNGFGSDVFSLEPPTNLRIHSGLGNYSFTCHNASNTTRSISKANEAVEELIFSAMTEWG